jgi:dTMP kinase
MFITLEGIEGCGKSTQSGMIEDYLHSRGLKVTQTLEPGGSNLGTTLRQILLDPKNDDITGLTELFLYLADRSQHVSSVIRPALDRGEVVLCDRFADSTVVYQGYGRGLDPKLLHQLNEVAVDATWPDLTLLLDLDPEIGLKRALTRNFQDNKHSTEGRFEAESIAFHTRIREGYLTWAALNRSRFVVIDAAGSVEDTFAAIRRAIDSKL